MTPDPLQERVARVKIAPLICGCGEPDCPRVEAVIAAVLADLREAGELRTYEQVGWTVATLDDIALMDGEGCEVGTYWTVPVYIVREDNDAD